MTALHRDYETRSPIDLKSAGAYVYMAHPDTDVWCCAYAVDDGPVKVWVPGDPVPPEFIECAKNPEWRAVAHNDAFERLVEHYIMAPRYGFPEIPLERHQCTMVMAYAMALPGSLENMLAALGSDIQKDMAGRRLMLSMSQPRRPRKDEADGLYWWDDDERKQRLIEYCKTDIDGERAGGERLVRLRPSEQKLWELDQKINDRGVFVDETLCLRAKAIVAVVTKKLDREMAAVTDWEVTGCTHLNDLKMFVRKHGVDTEALDKEALGEILSRSDIAPNVRRALEIRQEAAKASVAKINALLNGVSDDGRAKGLLQFHVANTGRWGGRRFQPQNIKRPTEGIDVDDAIHIILTEKPERAAFLLEVLYGPPLSVIGDCLRGMIKASPGRKLMAADFSNIEGRVLAWLAGEHWKIEAFKAYDNGTGPDLYNVAAQAIYGGNVDDVTKDQRQIGKVSELACGYQGGVGAFQTMAYTYGVKVADELAERIVKAWRAANPAIKQYWRDLDDAATAAVKQPGSVHTVGTSKFKMVGSFLWLQLPSGRALCFPYPALRWKEMPWDKNEPEWRHWDIDEGGEAEAKEFWKDKFVEFDAARQRVLVYVPAFREVVSFKGVDSYTRKWTTQYLYGGKYADYITQGTARDIMAEALIRLEAAGYPVILHVHDEPVTEPKADHGSVEEFEALMVELPQWAAGLPVAAEAWSGERYRK